MAKTKLRKTRIKPVSAKVMYKDNGKLKRGKATINEYLLHRMVDIDLNDKAYLNRVLKEIEQQPIKKETKDLYKYIAKQMPYDPKSTAQYLREYRQSQKKKK